MFCSFTCIHYLKVEFECCKAHAHIHVRVYCTVYTAEVRMRAVHPISFTLWRIVDVYFFCGTSVVTLFVGFSVRLAEEADVERRKSSALATYALPPSPPSSLSSLLTVLVFSRTPTFTLFTSRPLSSGCAAEFHLFTVKNCSATFNCTLHVFPVKIVGFLAAS